jgi:hypothetical protein
VLARVFVCSVPKRGAPAEECEDAWWVEPAVEGAAELETHALAVAVADGASESLLARRWARRLAATFGGAPRSTRTRSGFLAAYEEATSAWRQEVADYTEERSARGAPIQWYEEPGLAKGAHATIVAAEFLQPPRAQQQRWRVAAIGDSCFFQVRDEALRVSFPLRDPRAFSHQPPLVPSRGGAEEAVARHVRLRSGDWQKGDAFYLATDALAAWFLAEARAGGRPWEVLAAFECERSEPAPGDPGFGEWVEQRRDAGELHDDDTTFVRIEVC